MPYTWTAIAITLASGSLLFLSAGLKYWNSPSFRIKMTFLLFALIFQASVIRRIARSDRLPAPRAARFTGAALLTVWFGVAAAGRAIGYFG